MDMSFSAFKVKRYKLSLDEDVVNSRMDGGREFAEVRAFLGLRHKHLVCLFSHWCEESIFMPDKEKLKKEKKEMEIHRDKMEKEVRRRYEKKMKMIEGGDQLPSSSPDGGKVGEVGQQQLHIPNIDNVKDILESPGKVEVVGSPDPHLLKDLNSEEPLKLNAEKPLLRSPTDKSGGPKDLLDDKQSSEDHGEPIESD